MTNNKEEILKDYIPYGEEWEKEMMKLPKKVLIDMIRKNKADAKNSAIEFAEWKAKNGIFHPNKNGWNVAHNNDDLYSLWEQTKKK